jgi:hypothetical protein
MSGDFEGGAIAIPLEHKEYFDELGVERVRLQINTIGFSPPRSNYAREWLAEADEAAKKRVDAAKKRSEIAMARSIALQVEQTRLARSANKAACVAIGAALVALAAWIHPIH